ncbi:MAG: DUF4832 domain-containing protein [Clostridia bacterium]|nr:DUF4832 domain-containing protein [Clostridia bacterium]
MKVKNKIFALIAVAVAFSCAFILPCCTNGKPQSYVQQLNYTESTEKINNPDQGFYRPIYVRVTENGASYNRNIVNNATQLYHLRIDISAFSAAVNGQEDKLLSQAALDGLKDLLGFLKEKDKNAVVRFAYDPSYGGAKNKEPELQIILRHIGQVCPILNSYQSTVTAIEAGLIGPWGEMHSSAIANAQNISPVIDKFLDDTVNLPVLVRTPKMIYDYLGITADKAAVYTIGATEKAYRLGLFNDGYLGSNSDLGTYADRERDIAFLSAQTAHLPYGGEVVIPDSPLHNIESCLPEMNELNLSYLNIEWNNNVIDKWKKSYYTRDCGTDELYYGKTAFDYIQNHMGYRFVLKNSTFQYSDELDKLSVELKLQNVGFGNLNKEKYAKLIIADGNEAVAFAKEVGVFCGETEVRFSAKLDLDYGKYDVYLQLFGEEVEGTPLYCLQFANDGLWNSALKANKIGSMEYLEK